MMKPKLNLREWCGISGPSRLVLPFLQENISHWAPDWPMTRILEKERLSNLELSSRSVSQSSRLATSELLIQKCQELWSTLLLTPKFTDDGFHKLENPTSNHGPRCRPKQIWPPPPKMHICHLLDSVGCVGLVDTCHQFMELISSILLYLTASYNVFQHIDNPKPSARLLSAMRSRKTPCKRYKKMRSMQQQSDAATWGSKLPMSLATW